MFNCSCYDIHGNTINGLTQWDLNQTIYIEGHGFTTPPEIHFCNKNSEKALMVMSEIEDELLKVTIPNQLLIEPYTITLYVYMVNGEDKKTVEYTQIPVKARPMPSSFEYVDNIEIIALNELAEEIRALNAQIASAEEERVTAELARFEAEEIRIENENVRIENEEARQTAETTRAENEEARVETEANRVEAEALRVEAETARAEAETIRNEAEQIRIENEDSRILAENERITAEITRETNETNRVQTETMREENEAERISAEETRIEAEESRVTAETERDTAEQTRIENEETRIASETERRNKETVRIEAETLRTDAETARLEAEEVRVENEDARIEAETARDEAETLRASNEETRVENEDARVEAETNRNEAEAIRVENEETRQAQEEARETASATAVENAEKATDRANLAAEACENIVAGTGFISITEKGIPGGLATLDDTGKVPLEQLPEGIGGDVVPEGVTYINFDAPDGEEVGDILPVDADTLSGYGIDHFATSDEVNLKADGLTYSNSVLSLMSGDEELASVTIVGGSGSGGGDVILPNNVLSASDMSAADIDTPNLDASTLGGHEPDYFATKEDLENLGSSTELNNIINGTTQVGNAKTLDGHEAEYFFQKSGGVIDGDVTVEKENGQVAFSFKNGNREMVIVVTESGTCGVLDQTNKVWLWNSELNGTTKFYGTASGNLPLSGGGTVSKAGRSPIDLKSTNSNNVTTLYSGQDGTLGELGFIGANNPTFRNTSGANNTLLHTGNMASHVLPINGDTLNEGKSVYEKVNGNASNAVWNGYRNNDGTVFGGIGAFASNGKVQHIFIGADGETSYRKASGLSITKDAIQWKEKDLLHTGNVENYAATVEEGTFTLSVTHEGATYTLSGYKYIKIGKLVYLYGKSKGDSYVYLKPSDTTSAFYLTFSGIPFAFSSEHQSLSNLFFGKIASAAPLDAFIGKDTNYMYSFTEGGSSFTINANDMKSEGFVMSQAYNYPISMLYVTND